MVQQDELADIAEIMEVTLAGITDYRTRIALALRMRIYLWYIQTHEFDEDDVTDQLVERAYEVFLANLAKFVPNADDLSDKQMDAIFVYVFPNEVLQDKEWISEQILKVAGKPSSQRPRPEIEGILKVRNAVIKVPAAFVEWFEAADDPNKAWKIIVERQKDDLEPFAWEDFKRLKAEAMAKWKEMASDESAPIELRQSTFLKFWYDFLDPLVEDDGDIPLLHDTPSPGQISASQMVANALAQRGLFPAEPSEAYMAQVNAAARKVNIAGLVSAAYGDVEGAAPSVEERVQEIIARAPWTEAWAQSLAEDKRLGTEAGREVEFFRVAAEQGWLTQDMTEDEDVLLGQAWEKVERRWVVAEAQGVGASYTDLAAETIEELPPKEEVERQIQAQFGPLPPGFDIAATAKEALADLDKREAEGARAYIASQEGMPQGELETGEDPSFISPEELTEEEAARFIRRNPEAYAQFVPKKEGRPQIKGLQQLPGARRLLESTSRVFAAEIVRGRQRAEAAQRRAVEEGIEEPRPRPPRRAARQVVT